MATNYVQEGKNLKLGVSSGALSGDFDLVGDIAVVLLGDADDSNEAVCALEGVYNLSVTGSPAEITAGDKIYDNSGILNGNDDGIFFGHALEGVPSGDDLIIEVRLKQ